MYESKQQAAVTNKILNDEASHLKAGFNDAGRIILIRCRNVEAAYTADETRRLADEIEGEAKKKWDKDVSSVAKNLREVADKLDKKYE